MSHETLLTSIFTYLSNVVDLPDIVYPNIKESDLPDEHLRISVMPTKPSDYGIKNIKQDYGLIQVSVFIKVNIGEIRAAQIADKVLEAFKRNTVIPTSNIRVDRTPYASGGMVEDNYYVIPVTIEYNKVTV